MDVKELNKAKDKARKESPFENRAPCVLGEADILETNGLASSVFLASFASIF